MSSKNLEKTGKTTTGELTLTADDPITGLIGDVKNEEVKKPTFEKKIQDTNDTTGKTSNWQDSADYDIGDSVPYKLTATLADNVTDYTKYHITFHDKLESTLTYESVSSVKVNGTGVTDYELNTSPADGDSFDLTLTWGDGKEKITDTSLNEAKVEVFFSATLNETAILGAHGNVNTAYLEYSNNPNTNDDGTPSEDTDKTEKDFVIVFTYRVDINKTNENGKALEGATFKLEKKLADGTRKVVKLDAESTGSKFIFKGLDDGEYILTEAKAPEGYEEVSPITFTVTADHNVLWTDLADRDNILTALTGKTTSGEITLKADAKKKALTGSVKNTPEEKETETETETETEKPPKEKTVKTGDDTPIMLWVSVMLMSLAAAAFILFRRRRVH